MDLIDVNIFIVEYERLPSKMMHSTVNIGAASVQFLRNILFIRNIQWAMGINANQAPALQAYLVFAFYIEL